MQVDECRRHFSGAREVESNATFIIISLIKIWLKPTSVNRVQSLALHSKCIFKEEMSHRRTFRDLLPIIEFTSSRGMLPPFITHAHTVVHIKDTKQTHAVKHTQTHSIKAWFSHSCSYSWFIGKKAVKQGEERKFYFLDDFWPQLFPKCRFLKLEKHWSRGPTTPSISLLSFIWFVCHFRYTLQSRIHFLHSLQMNSEFFSCHIGCFSINQSRKCGGRRGGGGYPRLDTRLCSFSDKQPCISHSRINADIEC